MTITEEKNALIIENCEDFDPAKIFDCGQCFRWDADGDFAFSGTASGNFARVSLEKGRAELRYHGGGADFWRSYLDLDRDYASLRRELSVCDYMEQAAEFGRGIRILRQEPWETLCSFILSQCNNITRIKGMVSRLCRAGGESFVCDGREHFSFPDAQRVAAFSEDELRALGFGFRAPYVLAAARAVADGRLDLAALSDAGSDEALARLTELSGVGVKVACCVMLFGLGKLDAFPVDVWMKRALSENFPPDFDPAVFGGYAGVAQQYIYYFARYGRKKSGKAEHR